MSTMNIKLKLHKLHFNYNVPRPLFTIKPCCQRKHLVETLMHTTHTCVTFTHHDDENEGKISIQMNLHIMKLMHGESNDPQDFNGGNPLCSQYAIIENKIFFC